MLVHIDSINNKVVLTFTLAPKLAHCHQPNLTGQAALVKLGNGILIFDPAASAPLDALGTQPASDEAGR